MSHMYLAVGDEGDQQREYGRLPLHSSIRAIRHVPFSPFTNCRTSGICIGSCQIDVRSDDTFGTPTLAGRPVSVERVSKLATAQCRL